MINRSHFTIADYLPVFEQTRIELGREFEVEAQTFIDSLPERRTLWQRMKGWVTKW